MEVNDRQLDAWIDAALSGYADIEPSPGLQERILADARADKRRRPYGLWLLAAALLLAALLAPAVVRWRRQPVAAPNLAQARRPATPLAAPSARSSALRPGPAPRHAAPPVERQEARALLRNEPIRIAPIQIAPIKLGALD